MSRPDFILSQCAFCTRKQPGTRCKAFPDGIPAEILQNRFDHRLNYPGDNGVTFEALEGKRHPLDRAKL